MVLVVLVLVLVVVTKVVNDYFYLYNTLLVGNQKEQTQIYVKQITHRSNRNEQENKNYDNNWSQRNCSLKHQVDTDS